MHANEYKKQCHLFYTCTLVVNVGVGNAQQVEFVL